MNDIPAPVHRLVGLRFFTQYKKPIEFLGICHDSGEIIEQSKTYKLTIRLYLGSIFVADVEVQFPDGLDQKRWVFYIPGHESLN